MHTFCFKKARTERISSYGYALYIITSFVTSVKPQQSHYANKGVIMMFTISSVQKDKSKNEKIENNKFSLLYVWLENADANKTSNCGYPSINLMFLSAERGV